MKLNDAMELTKIQGRAVDNNVLPALDVAKRVFEQSARYGEPYERHTPESWRDMWLASDKFVLAEIGIEQVGIPYAKKINPEKVRRCMSASADGNTEPIVVDLNRQQIGKTPLGYVPKVIVTDGKHRWKAQVEMGKDRILAWVGDKALAELERRRNGSRFVIAAAASVPNYAQSAPMSNLVASASIYAAVAVKPNSAMTRQDTGDGGSRPTGGTQTMKWEAAGAGGGMGGSLGGGSGSNPLTMRVTEASRTPEARSSGSLQSPDPSDEKATPDPSDSGTFPEPSDRLQWQPDKPQFCSPGCTKNHKYNYGSPSTEAPGAGVGPDLKPDWGGSKSEFNEGLKANRDVEAGPIKVKKIVTKKKKRMEAVAPPGREAQVKALKKKVGTEAAFKIAWSSYNK